MTNFKRWSTMWSRLGAGAGSHGETVFQEVIQAYAEPHTSLKGGPANPGRPSRLVKLIRHALKRLVGLSLSDTRAAFDLQIFEFGDQKYSVDNFKGEGDGLPMTARDALVHSRNVITMEIAQRVADLVLVTRHNARPMGADACVLVDIDLSILGRAPVAFEVYERQIREEYAWVPEPTFRQRRADILQSFLARRVIYETLLFQSRYEAQARQTLARSIARLRT